MNPGLRRGGRTALRATAVDQEEEAPVPEKSKVGLYSWVVLAIMMSIRVAYQWQRAIFSYSFGYTGLGA